MKKRIVLTAALAISLAASALYADDTQKQEQKKDNAPVTLLSSVGDIELSGFGGLTCQGSRIGHSYVCLPGFRAGLIADDFVIGFSGYGLAYPAKRSSLSGSSYSGTEPDVNLGYGGLLLSYHFMRKSLINFSAGMTVGAGSISFTDRKKDSNDDNDHNRGKTFFYAEPELAAYINVTRFCRIGTAVSYRFIARGGKGEFSDKDLRNAGATVMAEFGWF